MRKKLALKLLNVYNGYNVSKQSDKQVKTDINGDFRTDSWGRHTALSRKKKDCMTQFTLYQRAKQ